MYPLKVAPKDMAIRFGKRVFQDLVFFDPSSSMLSRSPTAEVTVVGIQRDKRED
jgi:hypothetical protein